MWIFNFLFCYKNIFENSKKNLCSLQINISALGCFYLKKQHGAAHSRQPFCIELLWGAVFWESGLRQLDMADTTSIFSCLWLLLFEQAAQGIGSLLYTASLCFYCEKQSKPTQGRHYSYFALLWAAFFQKLYYFHCF